MDTLSSSVSSLVLPSHHHRTSQEFHHFKTPNYNLSSSPVCSHFSSYCKPTWVSSNKPSSPNFANREFAYVPFVSSSKESSSKQFQFPAQASPIHLTAASGYAAALVDVGRRNNSLEAVAKDVQRLSKWLRNEQLRAFISDPLVEEREKGQVLMEVAEKGRFQRHLVVMLKLLVGKKKLGLINDVLAEFERIYDELTGTCVVLVSSGRKMKMGKDKLFGIAKRVEKLSGALKVKVKVKVRHVFDQRLPSSMAT